MQRWLRMLLMLVFALIGVGLVAWVTNMASEDAAYPEPDPVPAVASVSGPEPEPAAEPAVQAAPEADAQLAYQVLEGGHRVEGRFGPVRFEAWADGTDGADGAHARFWLDGSEGGPSEDRTLAVRIASEVEGRVEWSGLAFDGQGPLPGDQVAVLEALAGGSMAQALARIPLDLACRADAEPVPAPVGAALLMPWQLLLKYAIDQPTEAARAQALQSTCGYFGRRTAAGDLVAPHPHLLMLSREQPIPMALPYLPLDGAGQRGGQP